MKWFPNAQDVSEDTRQEVVFTPSQYGQILEKQKRSSHARLSSTFTETRPWNFMSSSQGSDRSSTSSRKRRSMFGSRSSTASSGMSTAEVFLAGSRSPREESVVHIITGLEPASSDSRPVSVVTPSLRPSILGHQNWRSSLFPRKKSSKSVKGDPGASEKQPAAYGRNPSTRSSLDYWNQDRSSEDACKSTLPSLSRGHWY